MPIKTHFIYIDEQGELHQVGLGFLPFVPRVGEQFTYASQDSKTHLYGVVATFTVSRVSYEFYGKPPPTSLTWENGKDGKGCQVNLYVIPGGDAVTQSYLHSVTEDEDEDE